MKLSLRPSYAYLPPRLNVAELAVCLGRCAEVVRRRLRQDHRLARFVDGPPYLVDSRALALYAVTPETGLALLREAAETNAPTGATTSSTRAPNAA
jgi:hypothetical protein